MNPGFGVAVGGEPMAALEQSLAQLGVLVELAFEGDPDVARFVRERLPAAGDVDDRQPAVAERDAGLDVDLLVVGPAMRNRGGHPQQSIGWKIAPTDQVDCSCDATHAMPLLISLLRCHSNRSSCRIFVIHHDTAIGRIGGMGRGRFSCGQQLGAL